MTQMRVPPLMGAALLCAGLSACAADPWTNQPSPYDGRYVGYYHVVDSTDPSSNRRCVSQDVLNHEHYLMVSNGVLTLHYSNTTVLVHYIDQTGHIDDQANVKLGMPYEFQFDLDGTMTGHIYTGGCTYTLTWKRG